MPDFMTYTQGEIDTLLNAKGAGTVKSVNGTSPDANGNVTVSTTTEGIVQLAGDLAGTATAPTVTGGTHHGHTSGQVSGLATVATSGKYTDLSGLPTLGTAASTASTAYATAAQGIKADGALPSSSYTASDVLTKLKTVDGTGSGLDADLIDGVQLASLVQTSDARLSDARTPTVHASTHAKGGADPVSIDGLMTTATDTSKVLAPNGSGGVSWITPPSGGGGTTHPPIVATPFRGNLSDTTPVPVSIQPLGVSVASVCGSGNATGVTVFPVAFPIAVAYTSLSINVLTALAQTKRVFLWTKDSKGRPAQRVLVAAFDTTATGTVTVIQSGTVPVGDYWLGVEALGTARVQGWNLPPWATPGFPASGFMPFYYEGSGGVKTVDGITESHLADLSTYTGRWTRDDHSLAGAPTVVMGVTL